MPPKKSDERLSDLNREDIEKLIDVIHSKGIEEFELEQGDTRIRIVASRPYAAPQYYDGQGQAPAPPHGQSTISGTSSTPNAPEDEDLKLKKITSPMVGTFYRAASPGAKSFVEVGDKVDEDTVLCIVEAMKLMNEIKAEMRGVLRKIVVENAQSIEYGQPLFLVEPL